MNKKQLITGFLIPIVTGMVTISSHSISADALGINAYTSMQSNQSLLLPKEKSLLDILQTHNNLVPDVTVKQASENSTVKVEDARQVAIEAQNMIITNTMNGRISPGYKFIETRDYADDSYPVGSCTWGAKAVAPWAGNNWGNAGEWPSSALVAGFKTGSTPMLGAIASWSGGHVAVVVGLQADGKIQVLESNYAGNGNIAIYRDYFDPTTVQGTVTYIYPPADYGI